MKVTKIKDCGKIAFIKNMYFLKKISMLPLTCLSAQIILQNLKKSFWFFKINLNIMFKYNFIKRLINFFFLFIYYKIKDIVIKKIIPLIENKIFALDSLVSMNKRGIKN